MRLAEFITANIESIMQEWINFARTRLPAAASMNELALRNDAATILRDVVADMGGYQSLVEQKDKSQGLRSTQVGIESTPHLHATQRSLHGFETLQMVSEYRALRATVLRLWTESARTVDIRDVEDVTRFNESIDEALADSLKIFVTEADHRRHLFMGVLGHDLRGPLHTIMSCAQLLVRRRPEEAREAGMILRSATQIKALADDLLEFTLNGLNVDAPIVASDMQLDQFCRQTLEEIATISPNRQVDFHAEGDTLGSWDARRLHQLLWNLVANALKYGASDRAVSVILNGRHSDEVRLAVHNFGKPIPPEIMPTLLTPLVRGSSDYLASPLPAGANMGLGLYIANTIAKIHGGTIEVSSSEQDGTRFEVILPRTPSLRHRRRDLVP